MLGRFIMSLTNRGTVHVILCHLNKNINSIIYNDFAVRNHLEDNTLVVAVTFH